MNLIYSRNFSQGIVGKYAQVAERLEPKSLVLEVGCHTGYFSQFLIQNGHQILGVEMNKEALKLPAIVAAWSSVVISKILIYEN